MKAPSITYYLETLAHPAGRFKTLKDLEVETESDGTPRYLLTSETLEATVCYRGKSWQLSCCRRGRTELLPERNAILAHLQALSAPEIVRAEWLPGEMMVFDEQGRSWYVDVQLTELPEGSTLGTYLQGQVKRGDRAALKALFKRFAALAARLIRQNKWSHNHLLPRNIIVTPSGDIRLTDYRRVSIPTSAGWEESRYNDYFPWAFLTLRLYMVSQNLALGGVRNMDHSFDYLTAKRELTAWIEPQMDRVESEEFHTLYRLVRDQNILRGRESLAQAIERLAETDPPLSIRPMVGEDAEREIPPVYELEAPLREGLAVAHCGGKYGYVNREGAEVIPFHYDWADSFEEGLAVVKCGDRFGLINKKGEEVFPIHFEDLRWSANNGVVCLCDEEGQWFLMSREGERIGKETFDFIDDYSCGLASVRREEKHGYIDRKGRVVIPMIYDEVYSFSEEGLATVSKNGHKFCIDTEGFVVD